MVALLPGSRVGEVDPARRRLRRGGGVDSARKPECCFVAPMASRRECARCLSSMWRRHRRGQTFACIDGQAQSALAAADGAIVASGTATLETLSVEAADGCSLPARGAHRLPAAAARSGQGAVLFATQSAAGTSEIVPEFFQEAVTGEALGAALLREMEDPITSRTAAGRVPSRARGLAAGRRSQSRGGSARLRGCGGMTLASLLGRTPFGSRAWMKRAAGRSRGQSSRRRSSWIHGDGFAGSRIPNNSRPKSGAGSHRSSARVRSLGPSAWRIGMRSIA